jgi:hypothetical protein
MANETSRARWVRETRESTGRLLLWEEVHSALGMEGNLDIGDYVTGLGFRGVRSAREIGAALRWMEREGYAIELPAVCRNVEDPPGVLFQITDKGRRWATALTTAKAR